MGLMDPNGLHLVLEIHRSMLPAPGPFLLDEVEVWRDAHPVQLGSTTAWVPVRSASVAAPLCPLRVVPHADHRDRPDSARRDGAAGTGRRWTGRVSSSSSNGPRLPPAPIGRWPSRASWRGRGVPDAVARDAPSVGPTLRDECDRARPGLVGHGRACPSIHVTRGLWRAAIRPGASGHGEARPWQAGEVFMEAFRLGRRPESGPGRGRTCADGPAGFDSRGSSASRGASCDTKGHGESPCYTLRNNPINRPALHPPHAPSRCQHDRPLRIGAPGSVGAQEERHRGGDHQELRAVGQREAKQDEGDHGGNQPPPHGAVGGPMEQRAEVEIGRERERRFAPDVTRGREQGADASPCLSG